MNKLNPIVGSVAPLPPAGHERKPEDAAERRADQPHERPDEPSREPTAAAPRPDARAEEQQRRLDGLPGGGEREARLLYERQDRSFIVEIRDKETGEIVQTFPAEKGLNRTPSAADLLGTVIDRRS